MSLNSLNGNKCLDYSDFINDNINKDLNHLFNLKNAVISKLHSFSKTPPTNMVLG